MKLKISLGIVFLSAVLSLVPSCSRDVAVVPPVATNAPAKNRPLDITIAFPKQPSQKTIDALKLAGAAQANNDSPGYMTWVLRNYDYQSHQQFEALRMSYEEGAITGKIQ